jgi:TPP-dependent indolepyruvate ferredoxin oxidoreductase alpha subunit
MHTSLDERARLYTEEKWIERERGTELGILCSKSFATSLAAAAAVRTRKMFDLSHTQQPASPFCCTGCVIRSSFFLLPFVQEKKEKKKKMKKRALIL